MRNVDAGGVRAYWRESKIQPLFTVLRNEPRGSDRDGAWFGVMAHSLTSRMRFVTK